eukprot:5923991-Lingulodinium_polyedra.AAC.1
MEDTWRTVSCPPCRFSTVKSWHSQPSRGSTSSSSGLRSSRQAWSSLATCAARRQACAKLVQARYTLSAQMMCVKVAPPAMRKLSGASPHSLAH